jgi:hypothetical protein
MSALCTQLLHSNDKIEKEQKEKESQSLPTAVLLRHHKRIYEKSIGRCE